MVKRYEVEFLPEAVDDIERIGKGTARRILEKIGWLAENFEGIVSERLLGEFKKAFKLRVGNWRVIYAVNRKRRVLRICMIGHRSKIYRRKG
ncbi:MAG: type II toxin-antitoxin system mRNA interferase toxin, RelE/StbE family [Planctomycetota bacterium]|nr:MAG: type II toxin-antitoxin system mRNA interferase toxin, RelE/StbE family [Planctomycetota bacterium]